MTDVNQAFISLVFSETRAEIHLEMDGARHEFTPDEALELAELLVMSAVMAGQAGAEQGFQMGFPRRMQ